MTLTPSKCQDCVHCDLKSPLFRLLKNNELHHLNSDRYEVTLKAGDYIFRQGTAATHILSLARGRAKLFFEGDKQQKIAFKIACQWDLLGGPGLFVDKRYHYSAMAIEEAMVCYINLETFKELLCSNKEFGKSFWEQRNMETIHFYNRFKSIQHKQMHGKLADVLLYLSSEIFPGSDSGFEFERSIMSELTGMTRDTVVRVLRKLSDGGIIELKKNHIRIINQAKLEAFSRFG